MKCECSSRVRLPLQSTGRCARADWRAVRTVVGRTLVDERSGSRGHQRDVWQVRQRRRRWTRVAVRCGASAVRSALAGVAAARRPLRARRAARAHARRSAPPELLPPVSRVYFIFALMLSY